MYKKMRKIFALVIVLCMVLGAVPMAAMAETEGTELEENGLEKVTVTFHRLNSKGEYEAFREIQLFKNTAFDGTGYEHADGNYRLPGGLSSINEEAGKNFIGWTLKDSRVIVLEDSTLVTEDMQVYAMYKKVSYPTYTQEEAEQDKPLAEVQTAANSAIKEYTSPADYTEKAADEIAAIVEQAQKDIEAAQTEEEIKAIEDAAKAEIDKIETAEEEALIETVKDTKFKTRSKMTRLKGKTAIQLTWTVPEDLEFDGFEVYRSNKKNSGYGKKPIWTTAKTSYKNSKGLKSGKTYYYKVKAFKYVNDEKVYTEYSYKAWRTVKK